jgi:hypothetical protein
VARGGVHRPRIARRRPVTLAVGRSAFRLTPFFDEHRIRVVTIRSRREREHGTAIDRRTSVHNRRQQARLLARSVAGHNHLMIPLSVLDLSPIAEGSDAGRSLHNSLDLARHVEALGYRRYWMAEHHNLPGIASAATAVALAHIAAGTIHIRIGAGGIMLPNHAPLLIAEQAGRRDILLREADGQILDNSYARYSGDGGLPLAIIPITVIDDRGMPGWPRRMAMRVAFG